MDMLWHRWGHEMEFIGKEIGSKGARQERMSEGSGTREGIGATSRHWHFSHPR